MDCKIYTHEIITYPIVLFYQYATLSAGQLSRPTKGLFMKYEILSDNAVEADCGESATQYMFLEVPYKESPLSESEINSFCQEHFERRIYSEYDCTGKWFTGCITAKIVDDNDWDNKLTVAVIVNWGRDV